MDKETLSNYGWIVICVLVLAVMIALASPFGNFIADAVKSTTQGLFDVNQGALDAAGIVIDDNGFANTDGDSGEVVVNPIPEGGTYTTADGTTLNAGDAFPETVNDGDIYTYGDYKYTYITPSKGWKVAINTAVSDQNQTTYSIILESINGQPVTDMQNAFSSCKNLTTAPAIPNSVTNMAYTFAYCTSLTTAPAIPNGVTDMQNAFSSCTRLTTAPEIPSSVTNMTHTFYGCTRLTTATAIPNGVKYMTGTFQFCKNLTGTITINANPKQWTECLYNTQITEVIGDTTMAASILKTTSSRASNPTA